MKPLTRALFVAALSVPFVASAQNAPTDTSKAGGAPKAPTADTSKAGGAAKAPTPDAAKKEKLTAAELQIMARYHNDNLMEIELGKLAGKRGTSPDVKAYGEMLVKHHGDLDKQMVALAKTTGQLIPQEKPDPAKKEVIATAKKRAAALQKLNGAAFDREYLSLMVDNHMLAVTGVDTHVTEAKSSELAQMLRDAKPILQGHLDRARELQAKEGQGATTTGTGTGTGTKTGTGTQGTGTQGTTTKTPTTK